MSDVYLTNVLQAQATVAAGLYGPDCIQQRGQEDEPGRPSDGEGASQPTVTWLGTGAGLSFDFDGA